jgi:predicted  nucleic acid-binding Zn-ribbon protein
MTDLEIIYDLEKEGMSYGIFACQNCGNRFYGGGDALHSKGCPRKGYAGLQYIIGRKAFEVILSKGHGHGLNPITADDLREQLPNIVAARETHV